jgi:MFS family permease
MASASWSVLFRGQQLAYTALLTLGVGVHAVDVFIVSTTLPSVVADIGGAAFYTWATMLYIVASILGTSSGGWVSATYGFRSGYMFGAAVFLAGSVGCAVAPTMLALLLARTAQGLGGGLLVSLAYGVSSALYPAELLPRVFSTISGMWGAAALFGPMVGGVFAGLGWWRGAFWASLPVALVLFALSWRFLPRAEGARTEAAVPLLRLALLGAGVVCVALSGHVGTFGMRGLLIGSACGLVGLSLRLDAGSARRLFPSQPLTLRHPVGVASWMFFLFGVTVSQISVFLPLVVQVLYGVSPLGAGYFAALRSIAWTLAALGSAGLHGRLVRRVLVYGPAILTCGVIGQALLVVDGPLFWLGACVVLSGLGIGVHFAHLTSWTIAAARPGEEEETASYLPTVQALGFAFGAAFAGLVANTAGLTTGVSAGTVASAAAWVYGLSVVPPAVLTVCAVHFLRLNPKHSMAPSSC